MAGSIVVVDFGVTYKQVGVGQIETEVAGRRVADAEGQPETVAFRDPRRALFCAGDRRLIVGATGA